MSLRYTITLPGSPATDLATRELTIRQDGVPSVVLLTAAALSYELLVERDVAIEMTLVDIDTSGNRSLPSPTLAFVATDTIPPAQPGGMVVEKVEETP